MAKTVEFIAKYPKITTLGITTLAAAGYITAQMAQGLSFEEAAQKLLDLVEEATSSVISTVTEGATDIIGGGVSAFLEALLGENWKNYVYGFLGIVGLIFFLKLYKLIRSIF